MCQRLKVSFNTLFVFRIDLKIYLSVYLIIFNFRIVYNRVKFFIKYKNMYVIFPQSIETYLYGARLYVTGVVRKMAFSLPVLQYLFTANRNRGFNSG